ncbi:MAG: Ig-like surface protein [Herbinix sp.]|jgi:hypothetical protein|nr:Ig-like surface protein [Herbinix sp.]
MSHGTCTAANKIKVSSISITNLTSNYTILLKNETFTAKAKILPIKATNKGLFWSSSDPSIATVTSKGIVTAKTSGFCEITASAKDESKKKASFFIKVVTDSAYLCDGTWTSEQGDFTTGLSFTQTGSYSMTDIDAGNPIHSGVYSIDTNNKTITFDGMSDSKENVNEIWYYSFPSVNKMLLTSGNTKITYTRSTKTINKNYLCNKQGLLYSSKGKKSISINGYIGTASTITIPSTIKGKPVTSVSGLNGNVLLKKVVLPNTLTEISSYTFKDCTSLEEVVMPNKLLSILEGAFSGCSSLTRIILPDHLEVIEPSVFAGCSSLTEITIPERVTILFNHTFQDCRNLKVLTLPKGILSIEPQAMDGCENVMIYGYKEIAKEYARLNNFSFIELKQD